MLSYWMCDGVKIQLKSRAWYVQWCRTAIQIRCIRFCLCLVKMVALFSNHRKKMLNEKNGQCLNFGQKIGWHAYIFILTNQCGGKKWLPFGHCAEKFGVILYSLYSVPSLSSFLKRQEGSRTAMLFVHLETCNMYVPSTKLEVEMFQDQSFDRNWIRTNAENNIAHWDGIAGKDFVRYRCVWCLGTVYFKRIYSIGLKRIIRQITLKINPWVAFGLNNIGYLTWTKAVGTTSFRPDWHKNQIEKLDIFKWVLSKKIPE